MTIKEPMAAGLLAGLVTVGATAATFGPDPATGPTVLSGTEEVGEVSDAAITQPHPGLSDALGEVTYLISNPEVPDMPGAPTTDTLFEHATPEEDTSTETITPPLPSGETFQ